MSASPRPAFDAPWQARIFGLVDALKDAGLIESAQWSAALGRRLAALPVERIPLRDGSGGTGGGGRGDGDDAGRVGSAIWSCWVGALEDLLIERRIAAPLQLASLRQAWAVAAEKTPHGEPIVLGALAYRWAGLTAPAPATCVAPVPPPDGAPARAASARAHSPTSDGPA